MFSSQKAHPAQHWQVCLARQLRDCQCAIDAGDDPFAPTMKHLLLFLDTDGVPPTNNASEQALRPSVIFRKVNNGFCSTWGTELFAQVRSLVDRAKKQGIFAFDAISRALTSRQTDWLLS